jgi:hypothetical protein
MKQYIFIRNLMVISLIMVVSRVVSAASNSTSTKARETKDVSIDLLSEVETFQLGKKIFGGVKGLYSLGSGFVQTAPGAAEDQNPELDTRQPLAIENPLSLDADSELRNQLIKLIDKPNHLSSLGQENLEARLHVMINQRKEIVVLLVETDSDFVDQYLKSKLNYKKLSSATIGRRYTMKVTLKYS